MTTNPSDEPALAGAPGNPPGTGARENRGPWKPEELIPILYHELRSLARSYLTNSPPGHTLQPTALVHEAYLRLSSGAPADGWNSPGHFFGAAAESMRQILINYARAKGALKRGGDRTRLQLTEDQGKSEGPDLDDVLFVDEVVEHLEREDPVLATILKLRYFAGLEREETAAIVGLPLRTCDRRWRYIVARVREFQGDAMPQEARHDGGDRGTVPERP